MAEKKVVGFGFPFDREDELRESINYELGQKGEKPCCVEFVSSLGQALVSAEDAHVVVANTELCGDFFTKLLESKFRGHIVPFASSKSQMSKSVAGPGGKAVFPTNYRGLNEVILQKLEKPIAKEGSNRTRAQEAVTQS